MKTNPNLLAQQIQRMLLKEAEKTQWLEEIKSMNDEQLKSLAKLVREHDRESLELLEKRTAEKAAVNQQMKSSVPNQVIDFTPDSLESVMEMMDEILNDMDKLGEFLAASDDDILAKLEAIFVERVKDDYEDLQDITTFFHEIRLQKSFIHNLAVKKQEEGMKEVLREQSRAVLELGSVIAKAKEAMEESRNK